MQKTTRPSFQKKQLSMPSAGPRNDRYSPAPRSFRTKLFTKDERNVLRML